MRDYSCHTVNSIINAFKKVRIIPLKHLISMWFVSNLRETDCASSKDIPMCQVCDPVLIPGNPSTCIILGLSLPRSIIAIN